MWFTFKKIIKFTIKHGVMCRILRRRWHEHMHASALDIGQLHHQSGSAPSLTTHAADTVAAYQCHECDSDVVFTSHVKQKSK